MASVDNVARLIALNGGELVGKTRLQKSAYFLEARDAGFGFDFSYHHYGPYSEELASSTDDAKALSLINVDWKKTQGGVSFAVFSCSLDFTKNERDHYRVELLNILKGYTSVEIELAATADFLFHDGYKDDPWSETKRRKASKVNEYRVGRSKRLLSEIDSLSKS